MYCDCNITWTFSLKSNYANEGVFHAIYSLKTCSYISYVLSRVEVTHWRKTTWLPHFSLCLFDTYLCRLFIYRLNHWRAMVCDCDTPFPFINVSKGRLKIAWPMNDSVTEVFRKWSIPSISKITWIRVGKFMSYPQAKKELQTSKESVKIKKNGYVSKWTMNRIPVYNIVQAQN